MVPEPAGLSLSPVESPSCSASSFCMGPRVSLYGQRVVQWSPLQIRQDTIFCPFNLFMGSSSWSWAFKSWNDQDKVYKFNTTVKMRQSFHLSLIFTMLQQHEVLRTVQTRDGNVNKNKCKATVCMWSTGCRFGCTFSPQQEESTYGNAFTHCRCNIQLLKVITQSSHSGVGNCAQWTCPPLCWRWKSWKHHRWLWWWQH